MYTLNDIPPALLTPSKLDGRAERGARTGVASCGVHVNKVRALPRSAGRTESPPLPEVLEAAAEHAAT